jgi:membrane protein DedA with SNARE-associated domain
LAIFLGRAIRFFLLGILVLKFGPGVVHTLRIFFSHHFHWLIIAAIVALAMWLFLQRRKRVKRPREGQQ